MLASAGSEWERARLRALQGEIQQALARWRDRAARTGTAATAAAWTAGTELITAPLAAGGMNFAPRLNDAALAAMQQALTHRISAITVVTQNRINAEIAQVLIGTRPAADAITRVTNILGESTRRRARTIVYDETGRAYSRSSQDSLSQAAERLPGLRKQWLHSGKRFPRPDHVAAHGQTQRVNDPYIIDGDPLMYPRDPSADIAQTINCGCMSVPVTDGSTWRGLDDHDREIHGEVALDPYDADAVIEVALASGERVRLPGGD
ncbi:MAG TPA: hypothetical protein PKZ76_03355 [Xanthomonadaceae bacterium]|nr:hypothetical protein [Xanthomonadaceae bacterium]